MPITIGVGVTTYNGTARLLKFLEHLTKNSTYEYKLHMAQDTDKDRRGVAFRKNECLRALKHCDHVFLFDDDCFPIKEGWEDFFINSKQEHLLYLDRQHNERGISMDGSLQYFTDCGGVFMYMTKKVVERVGAFDERFDTWGFEHVNYSIRILGGHGTYPHLVGTRRYLYSEDYSNPNHTSSITKEEKSLLFKKNLPIFTEPIKQIYLPL